MHKPIRDMTNDDIVKFSAAPDNVAVELLRHGWLGQGTTFDFTRAGNGKLAMKKKLQCMSAVALSMLRYIEEEKGHRAVGESDAGGHEG